MSKNYSPAIADYFPAFEQPDDPFLFFYQVGKGGKVSRTVLTRGQFWSVAKKAANVIRKAGCRQGDCFANCFGANHYYDLAFRLGAIMTGTTPVTINWQADTIKQILFKMRLTESRLALTDSYFSPGHIDAIKKEFPDIEVCHVDSCTSHKEIGEDALYPLADVESTQIVVFTSGTAGQPRGARLSYRAYQTNRLTFEQFLEVVPEDNFAVLMVNPLHHTNSTAISDWALWRPESHLHLIERYSTEYWKILTEVAARKYDRLIAPTVSRHFDFLENLDRANNLTVGLQELKNAMKRTEFLIGSAPVGPKTIKRLQHYAGRCPHVRFGATETCLQVLGTPKHMSEEDKLKTFQKGWDHTWQGKTQPGFYIGRPHPPYTEVRIVQKITPGQDGYMRDCSLGQPGYLVTRGGNLMSGYVKDPEATRDVFQQSWYTGLKDICFILRNDQDGELDYFWMSRESTLLIRGGANYAYDQINSELINFVSTYYGLPRESFDIAVVGLKLESEHEDSCCVTIELKNEQAQEKAVDIKETFKEFAASHLSKGARPDYVRFGSIPRSFKGSVMVEELAVAFKIWLGVN